VPPSPEFYERCRAAVREARARGAARRRYRPLRWVLPLAAAAVLALVIGLSWWDTNPAPRPKQPGTSVAGGQEDAPSAEMAEAQGGAEEPEVADEGPPETSGQVPDRSAAAMARKQTLRRLAEERRGKLKRAQQALRNAQKGSADGALVPEPRIADVSSVVASGGASYWERLEAAKLLYRAHDLNGDLEKCSQAFAAYLDLVGQKAGPKAGMSKLVAEGSRLRRNRDFSRGIELYRSGYRAAEDASTKAELLCHIGQNLEHLRDHPRALEVYRYAATTFPDTRAGKDALVRIPSVYVNLSQVDNAIEAYRKCVESPSDGRTKAFCLLHIGILQEHRAKRDDGALLACLSTYRGIIRDFPETVSAREARKRLGEAQAEALDDLLSIP